MDERIYAWPDPLRMVCAKVGCTSGKAKGGRYSPRRSPRARSFKRSETCSLLFARERRAWEEWKEEREASTCAAEARREARITLETNMLLLLGELRADVGYVLTSRTAGRGTVDRLESKERGAAMEGRRREVKENAVQPGRP